MILAEDINAAVEIGELISETQEIRWSGNQGRTKEPHGTNPTAVLVDRAKNRFYSYKSGKGGGPIDWVMLRDKRSFTEARDFLARQCGLEDSPTFSERRQTLNLAQTEMRAFSAFLAIKRVRIHREIWRLLDLCAAALCFIELLDEMECDELEERRAIAAEGCTSGEQVEIAGNPLLASQIRDQLTNLHDTVTKATQLIDELETVLDRTHFEPEHEVEGFLRRYYAVPALREALSI
jgi:hypothetical protein